MSNLTEISNFLDRYKDFSKHLERQKIIHFKAKFDGLFTGYESLRNLIRTFNKKEAHIYNIFDILNIKTYETKTHTPFLKNLLDPNGTHGQEDMFLNSFIQNFIPDNKKNYFVLPNKNDYHVEAEKPIINGIIDIYVQSINPKNRFGIIIENKLLSADQHLQLKRYYDFLDRQKYDDGQMIMFYLTIYGIDPSTYSIEKKLLDDLKDRGIIHNLSYKADIKNWLQNLIPDIKANKVMYIIEQYLEIIDYL